MLTEKFIFKIHRSGHVERIRDCDNITFLDVIHELGISVKELRFKPISNSGIYAFYGHDVLILGIPERSGPSCENDVVHGILPSQFKVLSTQQTAL